MAVWPALQPAVGPQPPVREGNDLLVSKRGYSGRRQPSKVCAASYGPTQVSLVETLGFVPRKKLKKVHTSGFVCESICLRSLPTGNSER
jgi:hypothetical protein